MRFVPAGMLVKSIDVPEVDATGVPSIIVVIVFDAALIVLFVNVSVVALPTRVSVEVGRVSVPVLVIVAMTGAVSVNVVPFVVAPVIPPNAPALLYCTCVVDPPGDPPAGVAHAPSPRQKVDADADVPELRLVTGRLPVTPVVSGRPVAFVSTPLVGVPNSGVTNVGEVANTAAPVPVSSVRAAAKLALDGVARNVATPVPRPDTPVEIGRPVALVSVPLVGVPRIGVTSVGDVANTAAPVPVSSVSAAERLAEVKLPNDVELPTEVTAPVRLALVASLPFSF